MNKISTKSFVMLNGDNAIPGCGFFRRAEEVLEPGFEDANRLFLVHHQAGDFWI